MAEAREKPVRSLSVFSAIAVGAVTASIGIVAPALADPGYPSWDDIQDAKKDEATKQAEIEKIAGLISGLQAISDEATKQSLIAAEAARIAQEALDAQVERERTIRAQADAAAERATTSKMRAGLLAAHLARSGGKDFSVDLFLNGDDAEDLLHRLGTATKLGEQSQEIYREALSDRNTAASLADEAEAAAVERERLAADAQAKADAANAAAADAQAAVDEQVRRSDELYLQLAELKDSTAQLERERAEGIAAEQAAAAAAAAAAAKAAEEAANAGGNNGGGATPGGGGGGGSVPPANGSVVENAIAFAQAQLGDAYVLGGAGPDVWDCSGLSKAAYAYAGLYIGTHSATNQYNTMAARGRLVPFSERQRGDLIFWGGGGDYYHVAIYLGNGRIIEAPNPSARVREYYIWGAGDVAAYVGRPG